jgi:hypothetical protein
MSEYRALTVFDVLPSGCATFPVADGYSEPHLHFGEQVVVDLSDKDLQHGELYVIQWENGRRKIAQAWARHTVWVGREPGPAGASAIS